MSRRHSFAAGHHVISASRRTDIPAFYAEWFMTRIRRGIVAVPNPNNADSVSWLSLAPDAVDAIVFWTKDPRPLLPYLDELDERGYRYYFQYTLNDYPSWLEPNTPKGEEALIAFRELSQRLGPQRVVWRYDPVCFLPGLDAEWHVKNHARLAAALDGATHRCVISFLDVFRKTAANLQRACDARGLEFNAAAASALSDPGAFGEAIGLAAQAYGMLAVTCAEPDDIVSRLGSRIAHGKCIDDRILGVLGADVSSKKDSGQRAECGCVASREIGMYDSCRHGCAYCYATVSTKVARQNMLEHHYPQSASLLGWTSDEDGPPASQSRRRSGTGCSDEQMKLI